MTLYALKMPDGALHHDTVAATKQSCWLSAFPIVAWILGKAWEQKYWKRWEASLTAAEKAGYTIVPVKLLEE